MTFFLDAIRYTLVTRVTSWIKSHRLESFLLALTLIIGALLRLYRIDEYMTFLGDEGRDAIVVRRLLVNFDPILVGPGTSIGNMYLGPLYYYLIAPFLLFFNFSPAGPSIMVALLSIVTIFLIWHVGRLWFGKIAALLSALLYATSPVVVIYSRSSWNPNIMPFFALLAIYSIWRVYKNNEFKWLMVTGVSIAMALNSHYLALLLIPTVGLFWLLSLFSFHQPPTTNHQPRKREFFKYSIISALLFAFLMSPLLIFDARHGWRNYEAIKTFFTVRQETVSIKPWKSLPNLPKLSEKVVTRLVAGTDVELGRNVYRLIVLTLIVSIITLVYSVAVKRKEPILNTSYFILFIWLGVGLIGLALYKQEIYDHYFGFIFPAVFLLVGGLIQTIYSKNRPFGLLILIIFLPVLLSANWKNSPIKYPPNRQLQRSESIAQEIQKLSTGKEFNFAVIAERNYEGAYQYFFENDNVPFVMIDPQRSDETITDQLFVVCELPVEKCDPTHNSKAEVANFGWSKIESQKSFEGVTIFKLVHYNSFEKPMGDSP